MPSINLFWDNDQGALTGWNRLRLASGTTGAGVSISAGSVVDPGNSVISGVAIDLSGITASMGAGPTATTVFNNLGVPSSTSGDASWVSPVTHFNDPLRCSAVDLWYPHVITGLGSTAHTVEIFATTAAANNNRVIKARVNGGTPQLLTTSNGQSTNVLRFENIAPSSGAITIEVTRDTTSSGGNAYVNCIRLFEFVAASTMTVTTDGGELVAGSAFNVLCENFSAAPDDATFALNTLVDGVAVSSLPIAVTVTDNLDGTYDLDGTVPALPSSGSAAGPLFTDAAAGITHTISIDTV